MKKMINITNKIKYVLKCVCVRYIKYCFVVILFIACSPNEKDENVVIEGGVLYLTINTDISINWMIIINGKLFIQKSQTTVKYNFRRFCLTYHIISFFKVIDKQKTLQFDECIVFDTINFFQY